MLIAISLLALVLAACSEAPDGDATAGDAGDAEVGSSTPTAEATSDGAEPDEVTVGVIPIAAIAPAFVAHDKGYFAEEGLDVTLDFMQSSVDAMPLLSTGEIDVIFAGYSAGFFNALASGVDMVAVGHSAVSPPPGDVRPTAALVVAADRAGEFADIQDLRGATLGNAGGLGSASVYLLEMAMREHGLSISDVEVETIGFGDMLVALQNRSVDAAYMADPLMSLAIADGDVEILLAPVEGTSGAGILYSPQFADSDAGQRFFNAIVRALEEDLTGDAWFDEDTLAITAEWIGQDIETLQQSAPVIYPEALRPLEEDLQRQQQFFMDVGVLDYDDLVPAEDYIDASFSENAAANR